MNNPTKTNNATPAGQSPALGRATGSVIVRPKDGRELMEALLNGKTCEVRSRHVMRAVAYLDAVLSRANIDVKPSSPGWHTLHPHEAAIAKIRREVERDEAEDIARERELERLSQNNRDVQRAP